MNSVLEKLRRSYPNYSETIDIMSSVAQEILDSKDPFESMNKVVPTLSAMNAYILGMIIAEFIRNGDLKII